MIVMIPAPPIAAIPTAAAAARFIR
jgi:hypothetical protein